MTTATTELDLGGVPLTIDQRGSGQPVLLLHGGGGPQSVTAFAQLLADSRPARVITPVHPGFGGTPRPDSLATIGGLADLYASLLAELDLRDVIVVGNSIGGWIAAELALRAAGRIGARGTGRRGGHRRARAPGGGHLLAHAGRARAAQLLRSAGVPY